MFKFQAGERRLEMVKDSLKIFLSAKEASEQIQAPNLRAANGRWRIWGVRELHTTAVVANELHQKALIIARRIYALVLRQRIAVCVLCLVPKCWSHSEREPCGCHNGLPLCLTSCKSSSSVESLY